LENDFLTPWALQKYERDKFEVLGNSYIATIVTDEDEKITCNVQSSTVSYSVTFDAILNEIECDCKWPQERGIPYIACYICLFYQIITNTVASGLMKYII
jgi:hypothetical protein